MTRRTGEPQTVTLSTRDWKETKLAVELPLADTDHKFVMSADGRAAAWETVEEDERRDRPARQRLARESAEARALVQGRFGRGVHGRVRPFALARRRAHPRRHGEQRRQPAADFGQGLRRGRGLGRVYAPAAGLPRGLVRVVAGRLADRYGHGGRPDGSRDPLERGDGHGTAPARSGRRLGAPVLARRALPARRRGRRLRARLRGGDGQGVVPLHHARRRELGRRRPGGALRRLRPRRHTGRPLARARRPSEAAAARNLHARLLRAAPARAHPLGREAARPSARSRRSTARSRS